MLDHPKITFELICKVSAVLQLQYFWQYKGTPIVISCGDTCTPVPMVTTVYRDTALPGGFKGILFHCKLFPTGPHSVGRGVRLYKLYNELVLYT